MRSAWTSVKYLCLTMTFIAAIVATVNLGLDALTTAGLEYAAAAVWFFFTIVSSFLEAKPQRGFYG
jgi:hypothetical protein